MQPISWEYWVTPMSKRLLFCVETTKQANTDYAYIIETINHYYVESRKIVIRPVYMESRTRYNSRMVREEIRRQSGTADTSVIYCIDTDDWDVSADTKELLGKIREYCRDKGYDFVFFCRDVEDVYCGQSVPDSEKVRMIRRFRGTNAIKDVKSNLLERPDYRRHCSNILTVLDKYLTRKK